MTVTWNEIIVAVQAGVADEHLKDLSREIRVRAKVVHSAENAAVGSKLKTGDRVQIMEISPKYMQGAQGVVIQVNLATARVNLDQNPGGYGRFGEGQGIDIPLGCLAIL